MDDGAYACHMPWSFETEAAPFEVCREALTPKPGVRVIDPETKVWAAEGDTPTMTCRTFGKGKAVYLSGFRYSPAAAAMLLRLLRSVTGCSGEAAAVSADSRVECAWFPASHALVLLNNAEEPVTAEITWPEGKKAFALEPLETRFV